jgi:hypothetical protein
MESSNLHLQVKVLAERIAKEPENIYDLHRKLQVLLKKLRDGELCTTPRAEYRRRLWSEFLVSRLTSFTQGAV